MSGIAPSAADAIGNTPLVELARVTAGLDGRILMKLEYLNPGGSKKDRAAQRIIDEAEQQGALRPGQTVLELTSGNMGTGLAIVCAARGYPFVAVMSRGNSAERAEMMRALGAEVILVEQCPGSKHGEVSGADLDRVELAATHIAAELGAFRADQFRLPGNRNAHYFGTAPEIWAQSGGAITAFCDFAGSAGTFAGCTRYFRERNPAIRCYLVEPDRPDHPIQGGGYGIEGLRQLDGVEPDGRMTVTGSDAIACARRLAREEGIFAGCSSGANLAAALALLAGPLPGATVAIIACDSGLKYLSTGLWQD